MQPSQSRTSFGKIISLSFMKVVGFMQFNFRNFCAADCANLCCFLGSSFFVRVSTASAAAYSRFWYFCYFGCYSRSSNNFCRSNNFIDLLYQSSFLTSLSFFVDFLENLVAEWQVFFKHIERCLANSTWRMDDQFNYTEVAWAVFHSTSAGFAAKTGVNDTKPQIYKSAVNWVPIIIIRIRNSDFGNRQSS